MSSTNPAVREALRWLRVSGRDLRVALQMMTQAPPEPDLACWLCQQSAEKALKAALVLEGIRFPRTHNLEALRGLIPKGWDVRDVPGDLFDLAQWAIEARYPGAWPEPAHADAVRAESEARAVYDSVASEFKRRGVTGRS